MSFIIMLDFLTSISSWFVTFPSTLCIDCFFEVDCSSEMCQHLIFYSRSVISYTMYFLVMDAKVLLSQKCLKLSKFPQLTHLITTRMMQTSCRLWPSVMYVSGGVYCFACLHVIRSACLFAVFISCFIYNHRKFSCEGNCLDSPIWRLLLGLRISKLASGLIRCAAVWILRQM